MAFQRTTNNYPPFQHTIKNQVFRLTLDFLFFAKVRLEYDVVSVATCLNKNEGVKMAQRWCQGIFGANG